MVSLVAVSLVFLAYPLALLAQNCKRMHVLTTYLIVVWHARPLASERGLVTLVYCTSSRGILIGCVWSAAWLTTSAWLIA